MRVAVEPTPASAPPRLWRWLVAAFRDVEHTRLGQVLLGNVWPAYVFALPLASRAWGLVHAPWTTADLQGQAQLLEQAVTAAFLALVVLLFATRQRRLKRGHATFIPSLVALAGTFLLTVVGYLPVRETTSTEMLLASSAVVITGTLWTIWSLATLGRCFGLLPEVRGLVQRGPYRLVRHPAYFGELTAAVGLLLARPHPLIVLLFGVFAALQWGRTVYEERALTAAFPEEYPAYTRRVARLIPGSRRSAWLLTALAIALLIGELPHVLAACCAPQGATGFGTAWFANDFAQYESAMRQGAEQSGWLVHDPFTAEPHPDTFMFPLYVGIGKLAATLHLPAIWLEQLTEIVARALLVVALWRFCRAFAQGRTAARWAFGLTLFATGFELFSAVIGGYTGNWSYELNGFGLLFAAPHVPLAMAATLELARDLLRPYRRAVELRWLAKVASLSAVVALLHPFHAPVLLGAVALAGLAFWRSERGGANLIAAVVAGAAALPVLVPTVATFSFQPFWEATYSSQNVMPSPAPHELLVDLGAPLVLALAGVLLFRGRIAPFGLLLWLLLALIAMYLPVPYQRRLSFGIQPAIAVVAANALMGLCSTLGQRWARVLRLFTVAAAGFGTAVLLFSVVASTFNNAPLPLYRSTRDLDAAAAFLNDTALPSQVILADWQTANYLAARTPARVFGGHQVATLHPDQKQFQIATVFAHPSSLLVARGFGVQWLVYGPGEATLAGPTAQPEFQSGAVRVYRVA